MHVLHYVIEIVPSVESHVASLQRCPACSCESGLVDIGEIAELLLVRICRLFVCCPSEAAAAPVCHVVEVLVDDSHVAVLGHGFLLIYIIVIVKSVWHLVPCCRELSVLYALHGVEHRCHEVVKLCVVGRQRHTVA